MEGTFLDAAVGVGLLDGTRALAYADFLKGLVLSESVTVPIHGLELHLTGSGPGSVITTADFACLVEGITSSPQQPWTDLMHALQQTLGSAGGWVEFDAEQWQPPDPQPCGLPLLYFSPDIALSPEAFAKAKLGDFLHIVKNWLKKNDWSGTQPPEESSLKHWFNTLPEASEVQQIGLAFRHGRVQPRVLLNLRETGAMRQLLNELKAPQALQHPQLASQMLVAAAFPNPLQDVMGLELLADRCSLRSLRQMRQQPRLWSSRLARVLMDLDLASHERLMQLAAIEGRSSQVESDGFQVSLRGTNHLKIVLRKGQTQSCKVYLGEVTNQFMRTTADNNGASRPSLPTQGTL